MSQLSRNDLIFIAIGLGIGLLYTGLLRLGVLGSGDAGLAFLWIVAPLGIIEVAATYIIGAAPGTVVSLQGRVAALAAGLVAHMGLMAVV
jgi:hypothetical protein